MFLHRNIYKYTWTYTDGKTHTQVDHTLIDGWHSIIVHVRSFRGDDCDTDHYLDVAKATGRQAVSKQGAQTLDLERLNLRKLSELEVRKQYRIKISNRLTALEILSDSKNINRA